MKILLFLMSVAPLCSAFANPPLPALAQGGFACPQLSPAIPARGDISPIKGEASSGGLLSPSEAMLLLSGASSAEELSESEMERYETFLSHPLALNLASGAKLLSSGLLSRYQVASLCDYRERSGDVLSAAELALVEGFGEDFVAALRCFVSFESHRSPGSRPYRRIRHSALLRSGIEAKRLKAFSAVHSKAFSAAPAERTECRGKWQPAWCGYGVKYHLECGEDAEFFCSVRDAALPGTISLALYGRRAGKLIIGDFNARFGQGLALWSGFSLSGFSTVSAFRKNGAGLSPTGSFSPSHRGLGAEWNRGYWTFYAALSVPGLIGRCAGDKSEPVSFLPILACSWLGQRFQAGVQAYLQTGDLVGGGGDMLGIRRIAGTADFKAGIGHFTLFGEGGWGVSRVLNTYSHPPVSPETFVKVVENKAFAGLLGVIWAPAYKRRVSLLARCYPAAFPSAFGGSARSSSRLGDEQGLALGTQLGWFSLTLDAARHPAAGTFQAKGLLMLSPSFRCRGFVFSPSFRWGERVRAEDFAARSGTAAAPGPASGSGGNARWRHDFRADLEAAFPSDLMLHLRLNAVGITEPSSGLSGRSSPCSSTKLSVLGYLEGGCKKAFHRQGTPLAAPLGSSGPETGFSFFLRGTLFRADNWDGRIYCYERDLPASFSAPAFYGRGWALSLVSSLKFSRSRRQSSSGTAISVQGARGNTGTASLKKRHVRSSGGSGHTRWKARHTLSLRASFLGYFVPTADGTPSAAPRHPRAVLKLQYKVVF